ncbi:MAG: hypothetical protein K5987_02660 [Lachnospiraceae bacterium]|nr:hypothetical protein [Lachnospiraceae bacterium]
MRIRHKRKNIIRLISMMMTLIMFLSGCGSIVLSGNLQFEANPPIEPIPSAAEKWIGSTIENDNTKANKKNKGNTEVSFAYGDIEKYNVSGKRAFVVLPGHMSPSDVPALNQAVSEVNSNRDPKDALDLYRGDFEVIDYNEATKSFIYSYYVPYVGTEAHTNDDYPEISDTGLSISANGTVSLNGGTMGKGFETAKPVKSTDIKGMVFVLMSYNPDKEKYKVFFSKVFTMDEHKANDIRMLAGKVAGQPNYYAYADDHLYVYKRNGERLFASGYASIVSSKATYMVSRKMGIGYDAYLARYLTYNGNTAKFNPPGSFANWRWTVSDVQVDQNFMPYITLNIEYSTKDLAKADEEADSIVENDEDVEDKDDDGGLEGSTSEKVGDITYFHGTFSCLHISMDGSGMKFLSSISENSLNTLVSGNTVTIGQKEFQYSKMKKNITVKVEAESASGNSTSENSVTREENYSETLQRLKDSPATYLPEGWDKLDLAAEYFKKDEVKKAINDFGIFDTSGEPGDSGIYFALGGGSTGNLVDFYNSEGDKAGWACFTDYYNCRYDNIYPQNLRDAHLARFANETSGYLSTGFFQRNLASAIAATANSSGVYVPFLTPGEFGGRDQANYSVSGYYEKNGDYSLNGKDWITGHAQPLVSAELYVGSYYDSSYATNMGYKYNGLLAKCDSAGRLTLSYNGAEYYDTLLNRFFLSGHNQYYYNGVVHDKFNINVSDEEVDGPDGRVWNRNGERLFYYRPYVLAYHKTAYADGRSEEEYATIQNDNPNVYILPTQVLDETRDINLKYEYLLTDGDKSDVWFTRSKTISIPTRYRMMFPEGCYITISGDVWIGNMVKAENRVGAITYYSSKGSELSAGRVYSWSFRNDYPIYNNAENKIVTTNVTTYRWGFGWWLWYYFQRRNIFYDFYTDVDKNSFFTTVQLQKEGIRGPLYDRLVPGQAQDLGVWTVDGKHYVGVFTDQVVRFYEEVPGTFAGLIQTDETVAEGNGYTVYTKWETSWTNGSKGETRFKATSEIKLNELQVLTEGYFLREKTDGWVKANTTIGADDRTEKTVKLAEEAMNSDETGVSFTADNIMPMAGGRRFLYFSEAGSLYLLSLLNGGAGAEDWQKHGRLMPLMDGTYYRVFQNGAAHKLVGFNTAGNSYTMADTCMARVYDVDINKLVQQRADESVALYLESLRNLYLSENHTLLKKVTKTTVSGNAATKTEYSIVKPDTTDPEYARALVLFTGKPKEADAEMDAICAEYGVTKSKEMTDKLNDLRELLTSQRNAISEMYGFLGINFVDIPDKWQYIQYEGLLYNAPYTNILEAVMVEIVLSDEYLDPDITPRKNGLDDLIGIHKYDKDKDGDNVVFVDTSLTDGVKYVDDFAGYRTKYKKWLVESNGKIDEKVVDDSDLTTQLLKMYDDRKAIEDITGITGMDFYNEVLDVLEADYLKKLDSGKK